MENKKLSKSVLKSYLPIEAQSSYGDIVDLYYREIGDYTDEEFLELNSDEIEQMKDGYARKYNLSKVTFNDIYILNNIKKYKKNFIYALYYAIEYGSLNYVKTIFNADRDRQSFDQDSSRALSFAIGTNQFDIVEYLISIRQPRFYSDGNNQTVGIPSFLLLRPCISIEIKELVEKLNKYYTGSEISN